MRTLEPQSDLSARVPSPLQRHSLAWMKSWAAQSNFYGKDEHAVLFSSWAELADVMPLFSFFDLSVVRRFVPQILVYHDFDSTARLMSAALPWRIRRCAQQWAVVFERLPFMPLSDSEGGKREMSPSYEDGLAAILD